VRVAGQSDVARAVASNTLTSDPRKVRQIHHGAPSLGSPSGIYAAMPRDALMTGVHADRIARGSTRSSHRSTSSAPST
jgi:hypothetical protein